MFTSYTDSCTFAYSLKVTEKVNFFLNFGWQDPKSNRKLNKFINFGEVTHV